jgi:hypothetical protein
LVFKTLGYLFAEIGENRQKLWLHSEFLLVIDEKINRFTSKVIKITLYSLFGPKHKKMFSRVVPI